MDYYNLDEHHAARRERRNAWYMLLVGLVVVSVATFVNLRPAPLHKVSGYIVGMEWTKAHMSDAEAQRAVQAGFVPAPTPFVPGRHSPEPVRGQFTIWVANPTSVRAVQVDSATWFRVRCGQRYAYLYQEGWL
jgi:hypothetical protein